MQVVHSQTDAPRETTIPLELPWSTDTGAESLHETDNVRGQSQTVPRELRELDPRQWLAVFVTNWAVIIATMTWIHRTQPPWYLYPFIVLLVGSRQHALGLLGHEATHRLAFRRRWLNDVVSELFIAWPLMIILAHGYRPWHFAHHRHLGTPRDSELDYRGGSAYRGRVTWGRVCMRFVMDLCGLGLLELLNFLRPALPYKKPILMIGPMLLWAGAWAMLAHFGCQQLLLVWALSLVTGFWAVFRVRAYAEHVGVPLSGKETSHRFVAGPVARLLFFPCNTWCNYEHHKWPQVPFYHLPELRKLDHEKPVLRFSQLFPWM